jgi:predicted N-acetyltransferase YhbS
MIEIRDLAQSNIWDVAGFCFNHPEREETYSEGDEERYKEARERKKIYLQKMLKEGAKAKIAYENKNPVGFIEYYPVEITNLEIVGKDIMTIWCMDVKEKGKGIGGKLIEACLKDSKDLGRKGVAVTCWDPIWMPRKIFEKHGFVEVGKAVGNGVVLFKKFQEVENPVWIGRGRNYETQLLKDKVVIDLFHSDRCPIHWRNTALLKKIIKEFDDLVVLNEYNVDQRENMMEYKIEYSIYLNGIAIGAGPPIDEGKVRKKISEEIKRLN